MCKREPTGHRILPVFGAGTTIGVFVGSIGLGGAECQLPLLRHSFCFPPSKSVILNRARSAVGSGAIDISQAAAGVSVGLLIGIVASILSVADNELLFLPWSYYSDL